MRSQKTYASVVVAVALVVGAGGCGSKERPSGGTEVVDFSVQQHELFDDVLAIDAKRQTGGLTFSYVPKTRPAGLRRLTSNVVDSHVVDGYEVGEKRVQVMAEFAEQPTDTCASMKADPGPIICVREGTIPAAAGDPKLRNLTVYLSRAGIGSTTPDDTVIRQITGFWAKIDMVPMAQASWFTELVAQAKAAPKITLG